MPQTATSFQSQPLSSLKLSQLLGYIKGVVQNAFNGTYWVTAEVSNINYSPHNGHVYFDLVETEFGVKKAYIRGNLWAGVANKVLPKFKNITGGNIAIGMELLLLVKVEMHPLYGFSLTIFDINPEYTLGHLERLRQETIKRLKSEGVWDLNRSIKLPTLVQRIAVITSPTAAGWGDFQKQIDQNRVGPLLRLTLFPAMMQGNNAPASIGKALEEINRAIERFDAVIIIRGGGSKMDLSVFDDYYLCCLIANFPLPVITGIGHDRDVSVADMVAHTSQKTPTAVAEYLLRRMEQVLIQQLNAELRLVALLDRTKANMIQRVEELSKRTQICLNQKSHESLSYILNRKNQLGQILSLRLKQEENQVANLWSQLRHLLQLKNAQFDQLLQVVNYQALRLTNYLTNVPAKLSDHQNNLEQLNRLYDPQNIMNRGFLPVTNSGRLIKNISDVKEGDHLEILLLDGMAETCVTRIKEN